VNSKLIISISPSVYIAFKWLSATDKCGQLGPEYNATTIAFLSEELSTAPYTQTAVVTDPTIIAINPMPDATFSPANFGRDMYEESR